MSINDIEEEFPDEKPDPPRAMRLVSGFNYDLEEEANRLLAEGRRQGIPCTEYDYLSFDQINLRMQKEIYNQNGFCDEALVSGIFRRAFNPLSSERPTPGRMRNSDD